MAKAFAALYGEQSIKLCQEDWKWVAEALIAPETETLPAEATPGHYHRSCDQTALRPRAIDSGLLAKPAGPERECCRL